ncbi:MAG: hypothetical protein ACRC62_06920 [Microcoleus sp.]
MILYSFDRLSTINCQLSIVNSQLRGRARGHRPYQLSTLNFACTECLYFCRNCCRYLSIL